MSIATELAALSQDKDDIATALVNKGIDEASQHGFDQFADDIDNLALVQASKTATPYTTAQVVTPDTGYDGIAQVNINPIYYNETENSAGGITVTIGTVAPSI